MTADHELLREVAKAICRVQLNGGDPDQPAVRWNGTEMEPQDFPAWRDYCDEAHAAIAAYDDYREQVRRLRNEQAERTETPVVNLAGDEWDTLAGHIVDGNAPGLPGPIAANLCNAIAAELRRIDAKEALSDERVGNLLNDCDAAHKALADLIAVMPDNWHDDDDPEQAEAWRRAQKVVNEGYDHG